jgi:hypothetical protein
VTPVYLLVLFVVWTWQQGVPTLLMSGAPAENRPYLWLARVTMLAVTGAVFWMIHRAWKRRARAGGRP